MRLGAFLCFLLVVQLLKAQDEVDSLPNTVLPEVEHIQAESLQIRQGADFTLKGALSRDSRLWIKDYGGSAIATVSLRGAGPQHTKVLWEGVPLTSSANGVTDLSLLPTTLFSTAVLRFNGDALQGVGGAIGGSINLKTGQQDEHNIKLDLMTGSFGQVSGSGSFHIGRKGTSYSITPYYNQAMWNYPYTALHGKEQLLSHSLVRQYGLLTGITHSSGTSSYGFQLWLNNVTRELPPNLLQKESEGEQRDNGARALLCYKRNITSRWKWSTILAPSLTGLTYSDKSINLESQAEERGIYTYSQLANVSFRSATTIQVGHWYQRAALTNYLEPKTQSRSWFFLERRQRTLAGITLTTNARPELWNSRLYPSSSLILEKLSGASKIAYNLSLQYNLPTLNDLYWSPGGNSALKSERSWNHSLSYEYNKSKSSLTSSIYTYSVRDYIQWVPSISGFWSPQNLEQVSTLGGSIQLIKSFALTPSLLANGTLGGNINRTVAGGGDFLFSREAEQLIYQPLLAAHAGLELSHNRLSISNSVRYTGRRNYSYFHGAFLPGVLLHDVSCSFALSKKESTSIGVTVHNLWNQEWQSIRYRPMPPRYVTVYASISI